MPKSRKRHQKNQTRTTAPLPPKQSREFSPAAQGIAQRLALGGEEYLQQNLIRIMVDSAKLAKEPEFKDLYLDGEKTMQVTERWMKKYHKRLEAVKKKGSDDYQEVVDEITLKIIADLATPAFRKDIDQRLETLMYRLMTGKNSEKLEMVMMLIPTLRTKSIPWGLCGLIMEIYDQTMQRTFKELEEEESIVTAIEEALKAEGEDMDIIKTLEDPEKLEQISEKIFGAQPGLRQRAEKQILKMVNAFEDALVRGEVGLSLFSEEEIMLPFQILQAEYGEQLELDEESDEMSKLIFEALQQAITEIMTPERYRRFLEDVEKTAADWLRGRQKWAAALKAELDYLDEDQYEENRFVLAIFISQFYYQAKTQKSAPSKKKSHRD